MSFFPVRLWEIISANWIFRINQKSETRSLGFAFRLSKKEHNRYIHWIIYKVYFVETHSVLFYCLSIKSANIMSHRSKAINSTAVTPSQDNSSVNDSHLTLRVIFAIIAFFSLLGNGLVCTIILKRRNNLRNSYNLMIFALAIVDTLTGMLILCKYSIEIAVTANVESTKWQH